MTQRHFTTVATLAEVPPDTVRPVRAGGREILIVHHQNQLFAVEDRCSHARQPLACGRVKYGWIACPAHGARFDLATGEALTGPATEPIETFALRVVQQRIEIAL